MNEADAMNSVVDKLGDKKDQATPMQERTSQEKTYCSYQGQTENMDVNKNLDLDDVGNLDDAGNFSFSQNNQNNFKVVQNQSINPLPTLSQVSEPEVGKPIQTQSFQQQVVSQFSPTQKKPSFADQINALRMNVQPSTSINDQSVMQQFSEQVFEKKYVEEALDEQMKELKRKRG